MRLNLTLPIKLATVWLVCFHLWQTCTAKGEDHLGNDNDRNDRWPCPAHCRDPLLSQRHDTATNITRIFYLIIVHNEQSFADAVPLFRAIRSPHNIIAIHVDVKARHLLQADGPLQHEIQDCSCGSRVLMEAVHDVQWSQWSMNLPTFWGLQTAVQQYANDFDVFINLAGNTLPVYTTDTMAQILADLPYNFVTSSSCETGLEPTNVHYFPSFWHKRRHYTRDDTEPDPHFSFRDVTGVVINLTAQVHFGSQWVILQHNFCQWFVQEMQRPDSLASQLADHLRQSGKKMTDETFLATLIMYTNPSIACLPLIDENSRVLWRNGTASNIQHVRYERMDEHYPTAFGHLWTQQRYQVPDGSIAEQPRPWGPYYLGVYDLANIRASGALFVRKISAAVDPNMQRLLPVNHPDEIPVIQWPNHVSISEKPDWEEKIRGVKQSIAQTRATPEISDDEEL